MSLFLTDAELCELTRRKKAAAQARMLRRMKIDYIPHPEGPRVLRRHVEGAGVSEDGWEPDYSAIRKAS